MTPWLEIIIAIRRPGPALAETVESLVAQTDRGFGVILSDNHPGGDRQPLDAAQRRLEGAGIPVRRLRPPYALGRLEHWNWAHAQARADWLKPLAGGERLEPGYTARLRLCASRPGARSVICDARVESEWGRRVVHVPFAAGSISRTDFPRAHPSKLDWLAHSLTVAHQRTAWLAMGGYPVHLPGSAALALNLMLALHYGFENLGGMLAFGAESGGDSLNGEPGMRVNHWLERQLILRQGRNYCRAEKLHWPKGGILRRLAQDVLFPGR